MEEISPEDRASLENHYRKAAMIISGQIAFTIILTVVFWLLAPASENSISPQTLTTLWVVIIFLAVGAFVLRRVFFRWERLKDITLRKGVSGLLKTLQLNAIILAVFATLLSLVGCVIAVLSGSSFDIIRAEIVALIVFFINFPRKPVWERILALMGKV